MPSNTSTNTDVRSALQQTAVIIPARNEQQSIGLVLDDLPEVACVIVADNGSTDETADRAEAAGKEVAVMRHSRNRGYGAAIKTGIRRARFDWILITDADGTYPVESIPTLLEHTGEGDMVVGARSAPDAELSGLRQFAKWFLVRLAEYLSETHIEDLNSGLRLFRKDLALRFLTLLPSGFSLTPLSPSRF